MPLANFGGRPFMAEALAARPLVVAVGGAALLALALAAGLLPEAQEALKLAPLTDPTSVGHQGWGLSFCLWLKKAGMSCSSV